MRKGEKKTAGEDTTGEISEEVSQRSDQDLS